MARNKGWSISRFHDTARYGCPPVEGGNRPDHTCSAPWRGRAWVKTTSGERIRKVVYDPTEAGVIAKLKKLTADEDQGKVLRTSTVPTVEEWVRTHVTVEEDGRDVRVPVQDVRPRITNWWTGALPDLKVNTAKGYVSKINRYIIPAIGRHRLDQLTPAHVKELYRWMREDLGLAEASVRQTYAVLHHALRVAMEEGKVARNVTEQTKKPKTKRKPRKGMTVEEAWKVLTVAGDDPRFWLALLEGVRQGEALALRWSDIHEDDEHGADAVGFPYLVTREATSQVTKAVASADRPRGIAFDTPKSEESTDRIVPLLSPVADRLAKLRAESGGDDEALVFPNRRTGGPRDPKADWTEWSVLLKLAGVNHYELHAARNTTSQLLENAGVPDRVIAAILGHSSVQVTHRYQAGNLAAVEAAVRSFEGYWTAQTASDPAPTSPTPGRPRLSVVR